MLKPTFAFTIGALSSASDNAVALAVELSGKDGSPMTVLFTGDAEGAAALAERLPRPGGLDIRVIASPQELLAELYLADGAVVLPADAASLMEHTSVVVEFVHGGPRWISGRDKSAVCAGSYLTKDSIRLIFQPSG